MFYSNWFRNHFPQQNGLTDKIRIWSGHNVVVLDFHVNKNAYAFDVSFDDSNISLCSRANSKEQLDLFQNEMQSNHYKFNDGWNRWVKEFRNYPNMQELEQLMNDLKNTVEAVKQRKITLEKN